MSTQQDFTSSYKPTWCPGCGNFSIYPATKMALAELGYEPHQVVMSFGIGCSSNGANFFNLYAFHGIHGRTLPAAVGIKLANHKLLVIADCGDGDGYGEGLNHMIHDARGNLDINYFVHDNHLYSLTKGQMSPTTRKGMITTSTPEGALNHPFNPLATAIVCGATFVAQAFSGDIAQMKDIFKKSMQHRGFSLVNILQICTTFNKVNDFAWYKKRLFKLEDTGHDPSDYDKALAAAKLDDDKIPTGVLFQVDRETYYDQLPALKETPLVEQSIDNIDITESLKSYT